MLIKADQSLLLIIDIQERLAPAIHEGEAVIAHNLWLTGVARRLAVPVLAGFGAGLARRGAGLG